MHVDAKPSSSPDRVALVTGAGRGIGRAIAHRLGRDAAVAVVDIDRDRADTVAGEIAAAGGLALAIAADITDPADVAQMMEMASVKLGPPTILVNNAGNAGATATSLTPRPFWQTPVADWDIWFAVNLRGVMLCCHAVLPAMIAAGRSGRIITILSDAARTGEPGLEAYSAAKAGAAGFLRALALATGRYDITINMIAMGATLTPTSAPAFADEGYRERVLRGYAIRRLGTPEDAAAMTAFLASDEAGWITGQTIPVNGGRSFAL